MTPFIVTGASASGKTTLIEESRKANYTVLATHMTRPPRSGEIEGVHGHFMSEEQFIQNFNEKLYLEKSLDFARLHATGIYYGTPRSWLSALTGRTCAIPTSIKIAQQIFNATNVVWVHLICDENERRQRLQARGISEKEVFARMQAGDSRLSIPKDAVVYNTSQLSCTNILKDITTPRGITCQNCTKKIKHSEPYTHS